MKKLLPALLWAIIILILCLLPGKDIAKLGLAELNDKVAHIGVFAILTFLIYFGIKKDNLSPHIPFYIIGIASLYGFAIEVMQHFFCSGRFFDLGDGLADAVGSIVGWLVGVRFFRIKK